MVPYPARIAIDVTRQLIAVARAKGLKPGDRYVVLPLQAATSQLISEFYPTLFLVATFSAGAIVDWMGLTVHNPVTNLDLSNHDPTRRKRTVIIKMYRDDNWKLTGFDDGGNSTDEASDTSGTEIRAARQRYGDEVIVLDVSLQADAPEGALRTPEDLASYLHDNNLQIGKLLVIGHG